MVLRPYAMIIDGRFEKGLQLHIQQGSIAQISVNTGPAEPYVLSTALVNAHSHLEYRGLLNKLNDLDYWPWICKLVGLKLQQPMEQVRRDSLIAAQENRDAGVGLIAETSDRPFAGEALNMAKIKGIIYQELINIDVLYNTDKVKLAKANMRANRSMCDLPVYLSPHTAYTVNAAALNLLAHAAQPFSIHVAETELEDEFFLGRPGSIAELCARYDHSIAPTGERVFEYLDRLGVVRKGAQFVHCCALEDGDLYKMAEVGVSVAHCPRSNMALGCPDAPVRRMLEAGIEVGLGMDSAASSGEIDMFAEMRAALRVSEHKQEPLSAEQVWRMATSLGAQSMGFDSWDILESAKAPLIKIQVNDAGCVRDVIERAKPGDVEWVEMNWNRC